MANSISKLEHSHGVTMTTCCLGNAEDKRKQKMMDWAEELKMTIRKVSNPV